MSSRGGGGGRHIIHMRGLPFRVTEQEIAEWFSSVADPVDVMIHYGHDGRPSGEADAMFASEGEAKRAWLRTSRTCSTDMSSSSMTEAMDSKLSTGDTTGHVFSVLYRHGVSPMLSYLFSISVGQEL